MILRGYLELAIFHWRFLWVVLFGVFSLLGWELLIVQKIRRLFSHSALFNIYTTQKLYIVCIGNSI
jgi:hypothetical protein